MAIQTFHETLDYNFPSQEHAFPFAVGIINPGELKPEIIAGQDGMHVTPEGISVVCEGKLERRNELAFRYGFKNQGTDNEIIGKVLEASLKTYGHFGKAFVRSMGFLRGEFSLIASHEESLYAGRDRRGGGPGLYIGDTEFDGLTVSSDENMVYDFGARETRELKPDMVVCLGAQACSFIRWTFPARPR